MSEYVWITGLVKSFARCVLGWGLVAVCCGSGWAQQRTVQVCARDTSGRAIADVKVRAGGVEGLSNASGCASLTVDAATKTVDLVRDGFASVTQGLGASGDVAVVMQPASLRQVVDVTTARTPLALDATASSVRTLTMTQMAEAPGLGLDDKLRQVAGFQLFRRTSSWVANPTTQGASLRGLGSTAASRTLVLSDQVPLNDAFGGWIHWNEAPQLAIAGVELMRGGASDLYGSSAIGGVIDVTPVRPNGMGYAFDFSGADRSTSMESGLLTAGGHKTDVLAAATVFRTDGYTLIAPAVRGVVDVPSNVHSQSGRLEVRRAIGTDDGVFLRGNILNEARSNGTPLTTNATRLWRYVGGGDWTISHSGRVLARVYGSQQGYRQSFSSVLSNSTSNRYTENLTRLQRVPTQQVGGALQWAQSYKTLTFVAGGDLMDTRATDNETPVVSGVQKPNISTSARQRAGGVYGEVLWQPTNWSIAFSSRVDRFRSFDARQVTAGVSTTLATTDEVVFDPRLGVVRKLGGGVSLTASAFRAFRGPSMNELYRTGQVGAQVTQANPSLRSERATGFEVGTLFSKARVGTLRTSYFLTQVNRPIAAVAQTATLLKRQNLGQLTSKGFTVEGESNPIKWLTLTAGYQYADSTVSKYQADPTLEGKWTAQVPRNSVSMQARFAQPKLGVFAVDVRASGQQFDDTANAFRLLGYTQVDLYADHGFGHGLRAYASVQNVSGDLIEAGRTPILTLGIPRTLMIGVRLGSSRAGR